MRKFLFATAMFLLAAFPAFAASSPPPVVTKAPVSSFESPDGGWYVGLGTSVSVGSAQVTGNVITVPGLTGGGVSAAGGTVDFGAGYIWNRCLFGTWCQVEADVKYTNIDGNNAVGSINYRWGITEEFDIGADVIQTALSVVGIQNPFPTFNATSLLPSTVQVVNTPRGYVGVINGTFLVGGNVGISGGQTWIDAPGVTTGFRWITLGTNGKPNGGSLKIHADVLFGTQALQIADVFGAGGTPIVTHPSAQLNTIYSVGLKYDFGIPH